MTKKFHAIENQLTKMGAASVVCIPGLLQARFDAKWKALDVARLMDGAEVVESPAEDGWYVRWCN